eukprot:g78630.t1
MDFHRSRNFYQNPEKSRQNPCKMIEITVPWYLRKRDYTSLTKLDGNREPVKFTLLPRFFVCSNLQLRPAILP